MVISDFVWLWDFVGQMTLRDEAQDPRHNLEKIFAQNDSYEQKFRDIFNNPSDILVTEYDFS